MFDAHNLQVLDGLGKTGRVDFLQAGNVLALDPTPAMAAQFTRTHNRGVLRKYNTVRNKKVFVVDPVVNRSEFEECLHRLDGYRSWKIQYTDE